MLTAGEIELQSSLKPFTDLSDINVLFFSTMATRWVQPICPQDVLFRCILKPKRVTSFKRVVFNLPLS